jgi:hypothetical protein
MDQRSPEEAKALGASLTEEQREVMRMCAPRRDGSLPDRVGRLALMKLPRGFIRVKEERRITPRSFSLVPVFYLTPLGSQVRATVMPPTPAELQQRLRAAALRVVDAWDDEESQRYDLADAIAALREQLGPREAQAAE